MPRSPSSYNVVDAYNFGEAWARGDLTPEEHTLAILVALMCRGSWNQPGQPIGYALKLGTSKRRSVN